MYLDLTFQREIVYHSHSLQVGYLRCFCPRWRGRKVAGHYGHVTSILAYTGCFGGNGLVVGQLDICLLRQKIGTVNVSSLDLLD